MRLHRLPSLLCFGLLMLTALFSGTPFTEAQQPAASSPQAPTLAMPLPLGMQRGTTLELVLTGTNLADPLALLSSLPGLKATFPTDNNNGKEAGKVRVVLEAPKDAPLGYHTLRLVTPRGVSNLRLFCLDDLPQVPKAPDNKSKDKAQPLAIPSVVAAQVNAETSDFYKITVQAGQRLSFDLIGRRLGSPIDPQLAILDPKSQREIAYSNDAPGLQTDPRLTHTFKEAGEYLIEVRDVTHRGGADYAYRLRIGDFPCATAPVPLAAKRGSKVKVAFAGPQVDGVAPVEVNVPTEPTARTVWLSPVGPNGLHGWPVCLSVSDLDEAVEQEPNNEAGKATRVPVPGAITGRFEQKSDLDHFVLPLKKGRWTIEAQTVELYTPTEVYMVLKNAKGADVVKSDPSKAPRLDYTAPADEDFVLSVEHLHYWGGPAEVYRLVVTPYEPEFEVTLGSDRFDVPQGGVALVPIQSVTAKDYKGPIELTVVGNPALKGTKVIDSQAKAPQPNQPLATMLVSATGEIPMGGYPLKVQARATINGKEVLSTAMLRPALAQALGGLPFPPRQLADELVVGITEKPPFTLAAKFELPETLRGGSVQLTVSVTRSPGFDAEIALTPVGLPANVTTALKSIPKGANEIKGEVKVAANANLGDYPISFTGKAKHQNKDFNVLATPAALVLALPFNLKVEQAPLKLDPGAKGKIKVIAERKGGYKGPIALEVKNLPANVTAPKVNIDMDKNDVEIELSAAANAPVGDKADINVVGTAPAAANQQNTSPNFTVTINKK